LKHPTTKITPYLITYLAFLLAVGIFNKNAWVTEDAYILFRSLEQLLAGNGPRWNPHERVQVFTSPLWFWLLAAVRTFSSNVYLNSLGTAAALFLSTLFILKKLYRNPSTLLLAVLLFTASTAFFDYTSSGLENPLAYFLIALYVFNYIRLFGHSDTRAACQTAKRRRISSLWLVFGLIILVRHDLVLLLLPSILYVAWTHASYSRSKKGIVTVLVAFLPFILWSLFSLFYYGTFLPNSAYAKLNTGIDKILIFEQGAKYVLSSLRYDSITLCLIGGALIWTWRSGQHRYRIYLGFGIVLNLFYVSYVGGDFMQGRFYSYAYLLAAMLLLLKYEEETPLRGKVALWAVVGIYLTIYPNTPFTTPPDYSNFEGRWGISDERGFYFKKVSLYRYYYNLANEEAFPAHYWCAEGEKLKNDPATVKEMVNIGFYGYCAGIEKIIVDPLALSDPLLARLPTGDWWFIGHFRRKVPDGYINSLISGEAQINDVQINKFYQKIKLVTQSETLFTWERIKAIALLNLGFYNHYLDHL